MVSRVRASDIDSIAIAYRNPEVLTIRIRRVGDHAHGFFLPGTHDELSDVEAVPATHFRRNP